MPLCAHATLTFKHSRGLHVGILASLLRVKMDGEKGVKKIMGSNKSFNMEVSTRELVVAVLKQGAINHRCSSSLWLIHTQTFPCFLPHSSGQLHFTSPSSWYSNRMTKSHPLLLASIFLSIKAAAIITHVRKVGGVTTLLWVHTHRTLHCVFGLHRPILFAWPCFWIKIQDDFTVKGGSNRMRSKFSVSFNARPGIWEINESSFAIVSHQAHMCHAYKRGQGCPLFLPLAKTWTY